MSVKERPTPHSPSRLPPWLQRCPRMFVLQRGDRHGLPHHADLKVLNTPLRACDTARSWTSRLSAINSRTTFSYLQGLGKMTWRHSAGQSIDPEHVSRDPWMPSLALVSSKRVGCYDASMQRCRDSAPTFIRPPTRRSQVTTEIIRLCLGSRPGQPHLIGWSAARSARSHDFAWRHRICAF